MTDETQRRDRILAVAEDLLQRYGPGKTTMGDIARAADVAVGTLYLEFESKDQIVEALSRARHAEILGSMRAASQLGRPHPERVRAVIDARVEGLLELAARGLHACNLVYCQKTAPVVTEYARFCAEEHGILVELLRGGVRAGELEACRVEVRARAIQAAYVRFTPPKVFEAPRDETLMLLNAVHELVIYGLVKRAR